MKKTYVLDPMMLKLFDGAAAGGEGAGNAAADSGASDTNGTVPVLTRRGKTGENILYGKQPSVTIDGADVQPPAAGEKTALEDKNKAFLDLINGEYKDQYTQATQKLINRRFGEEKQKQTQIDAVTKELNLHKEISTLLMDRYGIKDGDLAKLKASVEEDEVFWEDAAARAGLTTEQYRYNRKLERENEEYARREQARQRRESVQAQMRAWEEEAAALKEKYPTFDLNEETKNPRFLNMLERGVDVAGAYAALHMDEIVQGATAEAERKVVESVRARGARPPENGTSSQSAFTVKDDVSKLTKQDRADIARKVARGERITF